MPNPCDAALPLLMAELDRSLSSQGAEALRRHLEGCAACRRAAAEYRGLAAGLKALPRGTGGPAFEETVLLRIRRRARRAAARRIAFRIAALLLLTLGLRRVLGPAPDQGGAAVPSPRTRVALPLPRDALRTDGLKKAFLSGRAFPGSGALAAFSTGAPADAGLLELDAARVADGLGETLRPLAAAVRVEVPKEIPFRGLWMGEKRWDLWDLWDL